METIGRVADVLLRSQPDGAFTGVGSEKSSEKGGYFVNGFRMRDEIPMTQALISEGFGAIAGGDQLCGVAFILEQADGMKKRTPLLYDAASSRSASFGDEENSCKWKNHQHLSAFMR